MLDWAPIEPLTLTFNVDYAKDEYGNSGARPYGLRDGSAAVYSIDAAYTVNENWQLTAWYTRDQTEATQLGQRDGTRRGRGCEGSEPGGHWRHVGVGLRGTLTPKLKAGLDLLYSKNVNKYPETITLLGAGRLGRRDQGPLPNITNTLTRLNLYAT